MSTRRVVLVGSVPLENAETVFTEVGKRIGCACGSIPDGETGARLDWIGWYRQRLGRIPAMEVEKTSVGMFPTMRLRAGHSWSTIQLSPLGYFDVARKSYDSFRRLKESGAVPGAARFQISIPTPMMLSSGLGGPWADALAAHERAVFSELKAIVADIPAQQLTIQWDFAGEIVQEELRRQAKQTLGETEAAPAANFEQGVQALVRACEAVPEGVELGIHCCFGDPGGKHIVEPLDAAVPVRAANLLLEHCHRQIDWIHVPVPIERNDAAYFAPLAGAPFLEKTALVLGLIHQEDGVQGARQRIAAAGSAVTGRFGVATECGLGRIQSDIIPGLLDLHKLVADI
jgi:hypothetical protein